jgi:hypothetical protein
MSNVEKIVSELADLKGRITTKDRQDATIKFNCHDATVVRYLNGEVKKEAFGLELLAFLKTKVDDREKVLA